MHTTIEPARRALAAVILSAPVQLSGAAIHALFCEEAEPFTLNAPDDLATPVFSAMERRLRREWGITDVRSVEDEQVLRLLPKYT